MRSCYCGNFAGFRKESKYKKVQGLLVTGFSGPPPPDVASGENFFL